MAAVFPGNEGAQWWKFYPALADLCSAVTFSDEPFPKKGSWLAEYQLLHNHSKHQKGFSQITTQYEETEMFKLSI